MQTNTNEDIIPTEQDTQTEEIKTTEQDTHIPLQEEPKKNKKALLTPIIVLLVLLLMAATAYATNYFRSLNNSEEKLPTDQELVEVEDEIEELDLSEDMLEIEEFLSKEFEKNGIEKYEITRSSKDDENSEFGGIQWFLENGEVGLIKQYESVNFDVLIGLSNEDYDLDFKESLKDSARDSLPIVLTSLKDFFLTKGFVEKDLEINSLELFEKDGVLCQINTNVTNWPSIVSTCGHTDNLEASAIYTEIYQSYDKKEENIDIHNIVQDFALLTRNNREVTLGGGWVIAENVDGIWEEKVFSQDYWDCKQLFEWGVKPELLLTGEPRKSECDDSEREFPNSALEYEKYYQEKEGL